MIFKMFSTYPDCQEAKTTSNQLRWKHAFTINILEIFSIRNKDSVLSDKKKKVLLIDPELFSIFEQDEKNICLLICRMYDAYITIISVSEQLEEKKKWQLAW